MEKNARPAASGLLAALLIAALFGALPPGAAAHPPEELLLNYDAAKRLLTVQITHNTRDPQRHFVRKIEVAKNKAVAVSTSYNAQSGSVLSYTYSLEAGPGDLVEVTATCSVFGNKTERLDMRGTLR